MISPSVVGDGGEVGDDISRLYVGNVINIALKDS